MDVEILARIQFAFTVAFHYIYPPLSIGLGVILVIMEGIWLKTKNPLYHDMAKFWTKIFALTFAIGVATGIVMEFEFGTNWATYSRYVGDIFGSALAAEGIFAFFLESGFLAVLLFGWNKVGPKMHFFSTLMVCLGAHFSAVWIIVANSWQQTPAGFHIVYDKVGDAMTARAEVTDFWAMVFNPSSVDRLSHTVMGAWLAGSFLVISVSAYYLLKKKHVEFGKASIKVALTVALIASVMQAITGHDSADGVAKNQPAKLAALEGHYSTGPADMYLFGWVNDKDGTVSGVKIPGMLSWLLYYDTKAEVKGLDAYAREDRPPVNMTFQFYHLMVGCGVLIFAISALGVFMWWRGTLFTHRGMLWVMMFSVLLPQIANQAGWFAAEVGRQPWIVYNLLRTSDALSKVVKAHEVLSSLILFTFIYALLFAVFIYLLDHKIRSGPGLNGENGAEPLAHNPRA
ncbi:MAG: cytochrome ubiquinol oxidase subunit I [Verrucomicrobiales bacterium]|jgi:cytochrome d ubiquinol oxidase subunit I|nr:cytochrome ubiquinol oxidase subunit I [Verrucomicrobiales bacterium]